jgi:LemA protein
MEILLLLVIVLFAPLLIVAGLYNSLIDKRNRVEEALSSIDVMLKKRYDLVELRTRARAGDLDTAQRAELDRRMEAALGRLMVAVEAYPDLKASENFLQLQAALNEVEEQLSAARRAYNAALTDYNNAIEMVPTNLLAGPMGLTRRPFFTVPDAEREPVDVAELFAR